MLRIHSGLAKDILFEEGYTAIRYWFIKILSYIMIWVTDTWPAAWCKRAIIDFEENAISTPLLYMATLKQPR